MSFLTHSQQECLQKMGIPWFEPRTNHYPYLLVMDQPYEPATQALFDRMMQALNWPLDACYKLFVKESSQETIISLIRKYKKNLNSEKVVFFSTTHADYLESEKADNIVVLPALSAILSNPTMKREAWAKMQPLIV